MTIVICALLSGAMFYFSQGMADVWWLAWIAPAPILWLAFGETGRWPGRGQLFAASVGAFALGQLYLFQCYAADMPVLIIGLQVLLLALMFAVSVMFAQWIRSRTNVFATLVAFPFCWTALEFLWGSISPNGTFAALGYSQVSAPLLIQSASLFGLAFVTFLICLCGSGLALAVRQRRAWPAAAIAVAILILNCLFGAVRLNGSQSEIIRVAAIADHSDSRAIHKSSAHDTVVNLAKIYAAEIHKAAAQGARLVVTAEGSVLTNREWRDDVFAPLAATARDAQIEIVAGVVQLDPPADLAVTFRPDGGVKSYDKRHLVPGLEEEFVPGDAPGLLDSDRATVICKDMDFPATIRSDAANGIRIMMVPAGDFVMDDWIHARMAILRGVENGFAVARAANDGLLTISDAQGRVIARHNYQPVGIYSLVADVPPGPGPTLYTSIGDVFAWVAIAAVLLLGTLAVAARR